MGWRRWREASQRYAALRRTGQYTERGPQPAAALSDGAQKLGLSRRAQATRKAILLADLPEPVRVDLLESVDELETHRGTDAAAVHQPWKRFAIRLARGTSRPTAPMTH